MRASPRTRIRPAAHTRAHTYIHPCTHTYARIRAREGIFLTTNLLYNITKPTSIISPTPFTSIIQSLYNPYPYWNHIGCAICTNCCHLSLICYTFTIHYHPFATITQLSTIYLSSIISYLSIISPTLYSIFIQCPVQLTILSICQSVIKPYQFSIYIPRTHIQQFLICDRLLVSSPYQIHYNHFHYGNRIPT